MKHHPVTRMAVAMLFSLLPVGAHAAEGNGVGEDLGQISKRMLQTGEQIRADMKAARSRFDAQKEAERQQKEAERQQKAAEQKQKEAERQQEAAARAERERLVAIEMQRVKQEQAAREKAAQALQAARKSNGPGAMPESLAAETPKEKAARMLREARQASAPKALAD
jgi:colicin import membrane protein